jgi:hypothetical protein
MSHGAAARQESSSENGQDLQDFSGFCIFS